jgi:hypothetical protein
MALGLHAMRKLVIEVAHFRVHFLDTVFRPVGGWGVERWVPRRPGLAKLHSAQTTGLRSEVNPWTSTS